MLSTIIDLLTSTEAQLGYTAAITAAPLAWRLHQARLALATARREAEDERRARERCRGRLDALRARVVALEQEQARVNRETRLKLGAPTDDQACLSGALVRVLQEVDELQE